MDSQTWSAVFAGISTLAAIITAIVAGWSLSGSRRDSRDRTRPLIVASLKRGPSMVHGVSYLVIENAGLSVARDVRVVFDPSLPDYEYTDDAQPGMVAPVLRQRYEGPIAMIAPGYQLSNVYSYLAAGVQGNVEPVPDKFSVRLSYSDGHGCKFEDAFFLDRQQLNWETRNNPNDENDPVKRKNKALEAIAWELWG